MFRLFRFDGGCRFRNLSSLFRFRHWNCRLVAAGLRFSKLFLADAFSEAVRSYPCLPYYLSSFLSTPPFTSHNQTPYYSCAVWLVLTEEAITITTKTESGSKTLRTKIIFAFIKYKSIALSPTCLSKQRMDSQLSITIEPTRASNRIPNDEYYAETWLSPRPFQHL